MFVSPIQDKHWYVFCMYHSEMGACIGPIETEEAARREACYPDETGYTPDCKLPHFIRNGIPGQMFLGTPCFVFESKEMSRLNREHNDAYTAYCAAHSDDEDYSWEVSDTANELADILREGRDYD